MSTLTQTPADVEKQPAKVPPVWVLGMSYVPVGVASAVTLVAIQQMLAAQNVSESVTAMLTAMSLAPGAVSFVFGPLLDWRLRRKTYAIAFTLLGGLGLFAAMMSTTNLAALAFWEFFALLAVSVGSNAVGGWFSTLILESKAGSLGAWFTAWNIGSGGLTAMFAVDLIRATSVPFGAAVLAMLAVSAVILMLLLPCKPANRQLAHESVKAFVRNVAKSLRSRNVLWSLLLFVSPAASFALSNILAGLGRDFATSEYLVGLLTGIGAIVAGVVGSLAMPLVERRIPLRYLYLLIGIVGACWTLFILLLPRETPAFALALLGEFLFQAAAFSVVYAITLRTIGENNPLAATQFSLLNASMCLPLAYMQLVDGQGLALGHVTGAFLMDAGVSGAASLLLMAVLWRFRRGIPRI